MDTNAPGAPRRAKAGERQEEALKLRIGGLTYAAIGKKIGVSAQSAYELVDKGLAAQKGRIDEAADKLREIELQRLDVAQSAIWGEVLKGDVLAIDRLLKIMARRAAYTGIDAPTKLAPTDPTGTKEYAELSDDERAARLAAILDRARARRDGQAAGDSAKAEGVADAEPVPQ